jgi:hypothetical protein
MIYTKIIGWLILLLGLGLIGWTLFTSYNIFTAKSPAPSFLNETITQTVTPQVGLQAEMEKLIKNQLEGMIPSGFIPKFLNLTIWSMLAFLLIYGGTQVSGIGIKLIKG